MTVKARLKTEGLLLSGEVNERLPAVTDGLVAYYPMDSSIMGESLERILPYENWVVGSTGSQTFFGQNGDGNSIVEGLDPWGKTIPLWQSLNNDVISGADGGWNSSTFSVDATKMYRFSVWIKRVVLGNGNFYHGTHGYPSAVLNRSNGASNTNPYFDSGGMSVSWGWVLTVGHVWPVGSGTGSNHSDTGTYTLDGTKVATAVDFVWATGTTSSNHRSYLYYSTLPETHQLWCYPKVEICDGSEPTLQQMLDGYVHGINPISNSNITTTNDYIAIEEATTNEFDESVMVNSVYAGPGTIIDTYDAFNTKNNIVRRISGKVRFGNSSGVDVGTLYYGYTYTFSIYLRKVVGQPEPTTMEFDICDRVDSLSYTGTLASNLTYEWQRFSVTAYHNNSSNYHFIDIGGYLSTGTWEWCCAQLEQKSFATEFTPIGSRSQGLLTYSVDLTSETTITFDYFCKERISNTIISNSQYNSKWWGLYLNNSGYLYMHEGNSGSSHTSTYLMPLNTWVSLTIKWTTTLQSYYVDGVLLGTLSTVGSTNAANIPILSLGYGWNIGNANFKNLSIYNRSLSDTEVSSLINNKLKITSDGDLMNPIEETPPGWTKVYEGVATHACRDAFTDYEQVNNYGMQFNQMYFRQKWFGGYEVTCTTTETAKLTNSIKWYIEQLYAQSDTGAPQIKFHGLDDVLDVGFTSTNQMFYGYGNSWRCYIPNLYVQDSSSEGSAYNYYGAVPSSIIKSDWGSTNYPSGPASDSILIAESGVFNLTPRKYQTIEIFVRLLDVSQTALRTNTDKIDILEVTEGSTL